MLSAAKGTLERFKSESDYLLGTGNKKRIGVNLVRDRIIVNKDLIPYSFEIILGGNLFKLLFKHNEEGDFYTVTLYKDGEIVAAGEPLIYGVPLFNDIYIPNDFPSVDIVPLDESGEHNVITKENFNETVYLTIDDEEEEDEQ